MSSEDSKSNAKEEVKTESANTNEKAPMPVESIAFGFGGEQYVKEMWASHQNEYISQLGQICYNQEFPVSFNIAKVKNVEELLFVEAEWVDAKLIRKRLTEYQVEYLENLKSKMFDATRKSAMQIEDYEKRGMKVPEDYSLLNEKRKRSETEYYEDALRIMFKIKLSNTEEREIVQEDKYRVERDPIKFAIDAVHLSFAKALPKKAKTLQNLYT